MIQRHANGGEEESWDGELLVVTAVAGGPRPICYFVPRRAVPGGESAYRALVERVEDWASAARGADPAEARFAPPPSCRPAEPGDGRAAWTVTYTPAEAEAADASLVARAPPTGREVARAALVLVAVAAVGPMTVRIGEPVPLAWILGTLVPLCVLLTVAYQFRERSWPGGGIRRLVRRLWESDPTFAAEVSITVDAAGLGVAGAGYGAARPWAPTTAARTAGAAPHGPFAGLPASDGGVFFVPRRAFPSDEAFHDFAATAERLRARAPDHAG